MSKKEKRNKKPADLPAYRWASRVVFLAIALSAALSLVSEATLDGASVAVAILILSLFILLGIVFDVIGVAVTAADARPFHEK